MVTVNRVNDMIITVDRIENNKIVFLTDNDKQFIVSKDIFPHLNEGDIINANVDDGLTKTKRNQIQNKLNDLFNK